MTIKTQRKKSLTLAILFFIHGVVYASLVPWIPDIKEKFNLNNYMVGVMVSAIPAGSITFGLLSKRFINFIGLYWATSISFLCLIISTSIVSFSSSWYAIVLLLFLFGIFDSWGDTCINVQAINIQKLYGRSLINRLHGAGSIGTIWGGLIAVSAIGFGLSMEKFSLAVLSINLIMLIIYIIYFRSTKIDNKFIPQRNTQQDIKRLEKQLFTLALIILVFTCAIEETASIWGAIYMKDSYDVSSAVSGLPYLACQILMVVGRIFGDYFTNRFGRITILKCGITLSALGVMLIIAINSFVSTILGFSLIGLGISVVFPLAISFIGQLPNINATSGITFATWMSRVGLLVAPPLIGMLADKTSLRISFLAIFISCLVMLMLTNILSSKLIKLNNGP
ncbi:putative membrane transport protein [Yersinia frederiksenii]|uniref:MFS transporter n=2 Tax=Yersinia alsatica TaxID=2890317 RepID=A0ABY5UQQ7_9GAMM|nr:MFS transporter [Yersinia alsatica]CFQ49537.1 putative membrane transport protein [Yersinia frederiksenii]UWM45826.1 MFS transporter [Yersinia alsatica]CNC46354.1 putative membrane transport protein [Yersinia frederiksenii]CNH63573.1 putative membrane transport protein [Yersinia frederiksenii]CNH85588.1 putative membrane transport protein [Yersinia frederiksenii]